MENTRRRVNKFVLCPFYMYDIDNEIHCEGMTDVSYTIHRFRSKDCAKDFEKRICCKAYHECLYCIMMEKKYEYN